jgi:hypothetical protein
MIRAVAGMIPGAGVMIRGGAAMIPERRAMIPAAGFVSPDRRMGRRSGERMIWLVSIQVPERRTGLIRTLK